MNMDNNTHPFFKSKTCLTTPPQISQADSCPMPFHFFYATVKFGLVRLITSWIKLNTDIQLFVCV